MKAELADHAITVIGFNDDPVQHGDCTNRERFHGVGLNDRTVRWVGRGDWAAHFRKLFHRSPQLDGTAYLQNSDRDRHVEMSSLARKQKYEVAPETWTGMTFDEWAPMVFPPGGVTRLKAWKEHKHGCRRCMHL